MAERLCPINNNLYYHGGVCIREKCEWWVTGTERVDTVFEHRKDYFCERNCGNHSSDKCCKDACSSKVIKGPGIEGGCCALKALAIEVHDLNVELKDIKHDFACLLTGLSKKDSSSGSGAGG